MHNFELIDLDRAPAPAPVAPRRAAGQPLVAAETDTELARAFLLHGILAASTMKSTKTELSRFLWWCRDRQLRLADLRIEDMAAYRDFLLDPQPRDKWISASAYPPDDERYDPNRGTRWPRNDPRWRPFSGPLSTQSARQAFRVARALTAFAKNTGYLDREPGVLVKNFSVSRNARVERYLGPATIGYVDAAIAALPRAPGPEARSAARDHFLFVAFVTTGARLSEIAQASMGAVGRDQDGRWWLEVTGKGGKARRLPVCDEMLACYRTYREAFGLPPTTHRRDATPLVMSMRRRQPTAISSEATANAITGLFAKAADLAIADGNVDAEGDLREASAHWLRHEMLTSLVNHTGDLKLGQDHAGHENIATTGGYLHRADADRHDAVLEVMNKSRGSAHDER
jgi:integrase/recombinase XerD